MSPPLLSNLQRINPFASKDGNENGKGETFPDTEDDIKAGALVDRLWEEGMRRMQPYHRQWYLNIAYLLGFQHLAWHPRRRTLFLPTARKRKIRMTSNLIMPAFRNNLARLTSLETKTRVVPNSNEQEDIDAARLGQDLWEHIKNQKPPWSSIKRRIGVWILSTGNGFAETTWDPNAGERLIDFKTEPAQIGTGEFDEFGEEVMKETSTVTGAEEFKSGAISNIARSPFTVVPIGGALDMEELSGVITSDWESISEIKRKFPKKWQNVKPEQRKPGSTFESQLESLVSPTTGEAQAPFAGGEEEKGALVKRLWMRDEPDYPKGRLVIRAGGATLHNGENPSPEDYSGRKLLPLTHYREIDTGFRFWGRCSIEDQIPDQKAYNKMESLVLEHLSLFKGKLMVPRGAKLKESALDNSADEVVEYLPIGGMKPEHMRVEGPQHSAFLMMQIHRKNLEDQSGVREASRGVNPPGVRSAVAIQELQEADNAQIAPTVQTAREKDAEVASKSLLLAERHMKVPQKLRIIGKNASTVNVIEGFTGDMLRGNTQIISAGPSVPFSLVGQKAEILDLAEKGFFIDPDTGDINRKLVLELMEFGKVEDVFSEEAMDEAMAEQENRTMDRGEPALDPKVYQDHEIHIKRHNRRRKSPEYQASAAQNPELEEIYESHLALHTEILLQQVQSQQSLEGQEEGVPEDRSRGTGRARMSSEGAGQ